MKRTSPTTSTITTVDLSLASAIQKRSGTPRKKPTPTPNRAFRCGKSRSTETSLTQTGKKFKVVVKGHMSPLGTQRDDSPPHTEHVDRFTERSVGTLLVTPAYGQTLRVESLLGNLSYSSQKKLFSQELIFEKKPSCVENVLVS